MPLAAAEIYLCTWRGTLIFLPGLPWFPMGRWHLPAKRMDALATSLRKVARLLWALHLSFLDGFDEVGPISCHCSTLSTCTLAWVWLTSSST